MGQHPPLGGVPCIFFVSVKVRIDGRVCNALLISIDNFLHFLSGRMSFPG